MNTPIRVPENIVTPRLNGAVKAEYVRCKHCDVRSPTPVWNDGLCLPKGKGGSVWYKPNVCSDSHCVAKEKFSAKTGQVLQIRAA